MFFCQSDFKKQKIRTQPGFLFIVQYTYRKNSLSLSNSLRIKKNYPATYRCRPFATVSAPKKRRDATLGVRMIKESSGGKVAF